MLQKTTIQFLLNLGKNNNKPWFDANRKAYEFAKEDFLQLTSSLIKGIASFDSPIGLLEAKKCIFRINRDVRFSKNKDPYKNNMGASLNCNGKKTNNAGYYFHLQPGNGSFIAGGIYMPEPKDLANIRQEIDYNYKDFLKIVESKNFKSVFGGLSSGDGMMLSRPPKGYDTENEAIKYLKYKSFIATTPISDKELLEKELLENSIAKWKASYPLIQFLNGIIEV